MLTVNLHLCNGDVISTTMTVSQKNRLSRTLNQANPPVTPLTLSVDGRGLEIPWRSIGYISTRAAEYAEYATSQAAD